jgi:hypothetical protein
MSMDAKKLMLDMERYLKGDAPEQIELTRAPTLDMWDVCVTREPNGERCLVIAGEVRGHPTLPNSKRIETSALMWLDRKHGWCRTRSRVYVLLDGMIPIDGIVT